MSQYWFWLICPFVLAAFAGPLAFLMQQDGKPDASEIYVVIATGPAAHLSEIVSAAGAHEVGPVRPRFARMVQASKSVHDRLLRARLIVLPAGGLASLCGVETVSHAVPASPLGFWS